MDRKANGISMCHYAVLTIGENGEYSYGNFKPITGLESASFQDQFAEGENYADDIQNIYEKVITSANITLDFANVSRQIEAELTGKEYAAGEMETKTTDVQNSVAIAFQKNFNDGSHERIVYYNCKVARAENSGQTKTSSISYQSVQLSGKAIPLPDGKVSYIIASNEIGSDNAEAKARYDNFFKKVQFKGVAAQAGV